MRNANGMRDAGRVRPGIGGIGVLAGAAGAVLLYWGLQGFVPGRAWLRADGDPTLIAALLKWHGRTLAEGDFRFADPPFFYPYRSVTFFTENFIGPGVLLSFLHRAPMEVVYTWALFLGHVTTLAAGVYLFRQVPVAWPVAGLAASLHTFNYTRLLLGYSHLHVVYDAPALLAVAELIRWYRTRRVGAAVAAWLALAVQFFFSVHMTFFGTVVIGILAVAAWMDRRERAWRLWGIVWLLTMGVYLLWVSAPYRRIQQWVGYRPDLGPSASAHLVTFLVPPPGSFWHTHGPALFRRIDARVWEEGGVAFPGFLLMGLFLASLVWGWRRPAIRWGAGVAAFCMWAALGPVVHWDFHRPLGPNPLYAVWEAVPALRAFRVPQRWYYAATVPMAWNAAVLLEDLFRRLGRRRATAVLALLWLGLARTDARIPPRAYITPVEEPIHATVRSGEVVAELPMGHPAFIQWRNPYFTMVRAVDRGFRTLDGVAAFDPPVPAELARHYRLDDYALQVLAALGVQRVVLHCHDYRRVDMPELCDHNRQVLTRAGYRTERIEPQDISMVAPAAPPRPRVVLDRLDLRNVAVTARPGPPGSTRWFITLKPVVPYVVAYPRRCYPVTVQGVDVDGRRTGEVHTCVSFPGGILWEGPQSLAVDLPVGTRRVRVGEGRRPRLWRWATREFDDSPEARWQVAAFPSSRPTGSLLPYGEDERKRRSPDGFHVDSGPPGDVLGTSDAPTGTPPPFEPLPGHLDPPVAVFPRPGDGDGERPVVGIRGDPPEAETGWMGPGTPENAVVRGTDPQFKAPFAPLAGPKQAAGAFGVRAVLPTGAAGAELGLRRPAALQPVPEGFTGQRQAQDGLPAVGRIRPRPPSTPVRRQ